MAEYLYWKLQAVADENSDFELFKEKYGRVYDENGVLAEYKSEEYLKQLFSKIAYKNPLFSKIYSLTTGFVSGDKIRIKYQIGEEKDLIQSFLNLINNSYFNNHTLVSLDSGVLLPYFGVRAEKNSLTVSNEQLKYKGLRPWNLKSISLRDYFQGAGDYNFNLKEMAYIYGLEADYIDYTEEYEQFVLGNYAGLMESAKKEISLIINCHRKSLGEEVLTEVNFEHERVEEIKPEESLHPMVDLVKNKEFTPSIKKAIQEACKGKRLTKEDKENLKTILIGAWSRTDFINKDQDSKARLQEKIAEVEQFITTL